MFAWLFQAASTLIFTYNIFIVVIYFLARVSTNKDCWLLLIDCGIRNIVPWNPIYTSKNQEPH